MGTNAEESHVISLYEHVPLYDENENDDPSLKTLIHGNNSTDTGRRLIDRNTGDDGDSEMPTACERRTLRIAFIVLSLMLLYSLINYASNSRTGYINLIHQPTNTSSSFNPSCNPSRVLLSIQYACGYPSIHGLWLDPENTCEYCSTVPFSMTNFSQDSILSLEKYWPNCFGGTSDDASFWKHEWDKHGSCSGMTQADYFSLTLRLFSEHVTECPATGRGECRLCWDGYMDAYNGLCK